VFPVAEAAPPAAELEQPFALPQPPLEQKENHLQRELQLARAKGAGAGESPVARLLTALYKSKMGV
jgi:hypothetical protein